MNFDPYHQLGVSPDATDAEIKAAWRSLRQKIHPDKNPDDPHATTRYQLAKEAFDILSDPARRSRYDTDGETKQDDLPRRAQGVFMTVLHTVLGECERNIVAGMADLLSAMKQEATVQRTSHKSRVKRFEKMLKRVRRKSDDGPNLIAEAIQNQIDRAKAEVEKCTVGIEEIEAAKALLFDYEDLPDEEAMSRFAQLPIGGVFVSTFSAP